MVLELARIDIKPGSEAAYEAAVAESLPLFRAAKGCRSVELRRCVERPSFYTLMIQWDTIEYHMTTFTGSDAFQTWRTLVGPHFAGPPAMEHVGESVVPAF